MRKAKQKPEEKGIYRKSGKPGLWLRYNYQGVQVRVPLHTRDFAEAIEAAKILRGKPPKSREGDPAFGWMKSIDRYLSEKQREKRPEHYHGKAWRTFRPGTAPKVRSCLTKFANWCHAPHVCVVNEKGEVERKELGIPVAKAPEQVDKRHLEAYRDIYAKKSKASARTTLAQILAFFEHIGVFPGRVQLPEKRKLERRELFLVHEEYSELIGKATEDRIRFVLYCGFHVGLRRGEIMHSRPEWFNLARKNHETVRVPAVEEVGDNVFIVKNEKFRHVPLSDEFVDFLKEYLPKVPTGSYCLYNPTKRRSKTGTYDFRHPFKRFVTENGWPALYPHAMRHSWISHLLASKESIQDVAAWSGDRLGTIEKSYWHHIIHEGAIKAAMKGQKKSDEERLGREKLQQRVDELYQLVTTGKVDAQTLETLRKMFSRDASGDERISLEVILRELGV